MYNQHISVISATMVHFGMAIICMITFTGLLFIPVSSNNNVIFVNSSQMLEEQFENFSKGHYNPPIILELDPSQDYWLERKGFTLIANTTITIKSMHNRSLDIICGNEFVFQSTRGLAFVNSNVTIQQVNFKSCGSYLNQLPEDILKNLNSSKHLYYGSWHSAALLFLNSSVYMNQGNVVSSYGFAIIAYNAVFADLVSIHVTKSIQQLSEYEYHRIGSGMILYFTDSSTSSITRKIHIVNSTFDNNMDKGTTEDCYTTVFGHTPMKTSIRYGVALTILYTQSMYNVKTVIDGAKFESNVGMITGAVLIVHLRASVSTTEVTNSIFFNNTVHMMYTCDVSGLQLYSFDTTSTGAYFNMLKIQNSSFFGIKNERWLTQQYGDINIGIYNSKVHATIIFERLHFTQHNMPYFEGTCIAVNKYDQSSHINVTMKDITAINNANKNDKAENSIFYYENVENVSFTGNGHFENNHGSVIRCENSNLFLYGDQIFRKNLGDNGGAIRLEGKGQLNFMKGANVTFIKNQAYLSGGAIYVDSSPYWTCGIQLHKPNLTTVSFHNNNGETAGNSIFVQPINECENFGIYSESWIDSYEINFRFSRTNETNNSLLELSTYPNYLIVKIKENSIFKRINLLPKLPQTYPGKTMILKIRTTDIINRIVFSFIITQFVSHERVWFQQSGGNIALEGVDNFMNTSIHTTSSKKTITVSLVMTVPNIFRKTYPIELLPCPLGFHLDQISGSCVCSSILQILPKTECSIQDSTITRDSNGHIWIGTIDTKLAISNTCPYSYCNSDSKCRRVKSTDGEIMLMNDTNELVPFCENGRHGVLCGKCNDTHQYSLVFGSTECKQCSNWWLLTIIVYAVIGPLLIFTLFAFKLTLTTGTLNGMIFYSQVYNAGLLEFLSRMDNINESVSILSSICKLVLSIVNTDQNFPMCLYNGMNQLWKTGLGLTFPVYLLLLVVIIIILSRYSTWLSNKTSHSSVQVLVTVVHLSFSKLLLTLIDVYTPANIYTSPNDSYRVWYWDGSVKFLGSSHSILATVTTITVGLFIVPYIALLLIGKHLIRYSKRFNLYIRPVYEAIHAPYKDNRQYWFGARLLLTITIYIVYVMFRTRNYTILSIIILTLVTGFTVAQAIARPFKSFGLNILDTWLMFNITLVYNNTLWDTTDISSIKIVFTLIFVLLAIATFVMIIVFHIVVSTKCSRTWIKNKLTRVKKYYYHIPLTTCISSRKKKKPIHGNDSYYSPCSHYREPLIMDSTDECDM